MMHITYSPFPIRHPLPAVTRHHIFKLLLQILPPQPRKYPPDDPEPPHRTRKNIRPRNAHQKRTTTRTHPADVQQDAGAAA